MECYTPKYYHAFRCLAGACPDSCCKEWEVDVDSTSAAFYRSLPGSLGDCLRQVLQDTPDGDTFMTIENGRCPMWQEDGLCRIHATLGHDALCQTCRDYPRMTHDYGNFMEQGLELSCPEAARLILTGAQDLICHQIPGGEEPDYSTDVMRILRRSRDTAFQILSIQSIPEALATLLLFAHAVQAELDGEEPAIFDPNCIQPLRAVLPYQPDLNAFFKFFQELEILTPQWQLRLSAGPQLSHWSESLRNLARYGILRYWLQAVTDLDLVCRVKLILAACLLVYNLGGDSIDTAQLFSKEIENNPDNVACILDGAYTAPALTDANLLSMLLL